MSYDWLIPILIVLMAWCAYRIMVSRINKRKDWHEETLERYYRYKDRAEDRSKDWG